MKKLLFNIVAATLGLWLANQFVPGVKVLLIPNSSFFGISLTQNWHIFLLLGITLGLLTLFVKPILDAITLPLRIITFGLFGFIINMAIIWIVDVMFEELSAPWLYPLLFTTLIIWALNTILSMFIREK